MKPKKATQKTTTFKYETPQSRISKSDIFTIRVKNASDIQSDISLFDAEINGKLSDEKIMHDKFIHVYSHNNQIFQNQAIDYPALLRTILKKSLTVEMVVFQNWAAGKISNMKIFDGKKWSDHPIVPDIYQNQTNIVLLRLDKNYGVINKSTKWVLSLPANSFIDLFIYAKR